MASDAADGFGLADALDAQPDPAAGPTGSAEAGPEPDAAAGGEGDAPPDEEKEGAEPSPTPPEPEPEAPKISYEPEAWVRKDLPGEMHRSFCVYQGALGWPCDARYNFKLLGRTLLYITGNSIQFLDLDDPSKSSVMHSFTIGGVGSIAVHPDGELFAVAENCEEPNIYIYHWPSLEIKKILQHGTRRQYTNIEFNADGTRLASVGGDPDYLLSVWDWPNEKLMLRTKAYAQDVYRVEFSPLDADRLITGGIGHVRFWEMALTFTGKKLKGDIGKYGQIEISDVSAFVELPNGNVITGSESGHVYMWDAEFIQCTVERLGKTPLHEGMIEFVEVRKGGDYMITAGLDGFVRHWDVTGLQYADLPEDDPFFRVELLREWRVSDRSQLRGLVKGDGFYVVQDSAGAMWEANIDAEEPTGKQLFETHSAPIGGMCMAPDSHCAATGDCGGLLRVWDLTTQKVTQSARVAAGIRCVLWPGEEVSASKSRLLLGCEDGVIRSVESWGGGLSVVASVKPHDAPVRELCLSPDGEMLVSAAEDGTMFFFGQKAGELSPIGFVQLEARGHHLQWAPDGAKLMCAVGSQVLEFQRPSGDIDTTKSFKMELEHTAFTLQIKLPKLKKEEDAEEEDGEPQVRTRELPVAAACYAAQGRLLCTSSEAEYAQFLYECSAKLKFPTRTVETNARRPVDTLQATSDGSAYLLGTRGGLVEVRPAADTSRALLATAHGGFESITHAATSFDMKYLLTASDSGNIFLYRVDLEAAVKHLAPPQEAVELPEPTPVVPEREAGRPAGEIEDAPGTGYSLENEKVQRKLDDMRTEAEKKKDGLLARLEDIRRRYQELQAKNRAVAEDLRLGHEDTDLDVTMRERMAQLEASDLERTRKELGWNAARLELALKKLEKTFLDEVESESVTIWSFDGRFGTALCRVEKPKGWVAQALEDIEEELRAAQDDEKDEAPSVDPSLSKSASVAKTKRKQSIAAQAADDRKQRRDGLIRAKAAHKASKPSADEWDPKDAGMIEHFSKNMGDYSLKSGDEYVVPEHKRAYASGYLRQMILLYDSLRQMKADFNSKLLRLRDLKTDMISNIQKDGERVREINDMLGIEEELPLPSIDPAEWTESRYKYTHADVTAFEARLDAERIAAELLAKASAYGGGGGGDNDEKEQSKAELEAKRAAEAKQQEEQREARRRELAERWGEVRESPKAVARLQYERRRLQDEITEMRAAFDEALLQLRQDKFQLIAEVQSATLKLSRLFVGTRALKDFEVQETEMNNKLLQARTNKAQVLLDLSACQEKLDAQLQSIKTWQRKSRALQKEFTELVGGDKNPHYPTLKAIYQKKIKRKREKGDGEDSDSDSEDWSDSDSDSDTEKVPDACPQGCDTAIYEKVLELREKRLDLEDTLAKYEKQVADLRNSYRGLESKNNACDKQLEACESDIDRFQTQKQRELNNIHYYTPVSLRQIRCLERHGEDGDPRMPLEPGDMLVFSWDRLQKLERRVNELVQEQHKLKQENAELARLARTLTVQTKQKRQELEQEKAKCEDVQMLRYGMLVPLAILDEAAEADDTLDVKDEMAMQEKAIQDRVKQWNKRVYAENEKLALARHANTERLEKLAQLVADKQHLDKQLDGATTDMIGAGMSGGAAGAEMPGLVELAKAQASEVDALKAEITMLQRKGGYLYQEPDTATGEPAAAGQAPERHD